ncbi:MAG TPA: glycosyl hydrolase 115 family protein, partial [Segetibacter sp.]
LGSIQSELIEKALGNQSAAYKNLTNKWECYGMKVINKFSQYNHQALIIAGSDLRGTAYGVFDISERIGVSPWYWWADVNPTRKNELSVNITEFISSPPSVKYRGIFLNDEDWGLQPWAAKTFESETGDIGPKTYAKIFELLLRLKANLIWPAMHPGTKAFYHYPGNKKVAADYAIIIGSSHAEPMLRNNVGEWDEKTMGAFNYLTNKERVAKYWEERVKESSSNEAVYSMGMRGVHDSGIEGVKTPEEVVPLLERIFGDQREMLKKYVNKDIKAVPQVFTAYKEVLDVYDANLKLPDDITLVWPDDNYGYIQRLDNDKEQQRSGGSGVYYHASYWGRPHDYLWLSTTHPALIREEMMKAYEMKSDRLWVMNVGDLKPLEYNIQLFLDMAYNAKPFKDSRYVKSHLQNWASGIFGKNNAASIQNVLWQYYQLAFERRPEFMGWSQTEPTTKINYTSYNHFYFGDEAQRRIEKYEALEKQVKDLKKRMSPKDADAFYELVYYPVVGASLMNKKFLYNDKSYLYAKQNRRSTSDYAALAKQAYDSIVSETAYYNDKLANGKWKNMMSMKPRNLPVYELPVLPKIVIDKSAAWGIAPEGFGNADSSLTSSAQNFTLPKFSSLSNEKYFIDIFLSDDKEINWISSTSQNWISLSQTKGTLQPVFGNNQVRLWVSIDWKKIAAKGEVKGVIIFTGGGKTFSVNVTADNTKEEDLLNYKGFVENNGLISIHASNFTRQTAAKETKWQIIEDLGHTGKVIEALPLKTNTSIDLVNSEIDKANTSFVEYDFYNTTAATPGVKLFALPTHPLNKNFSVRCAVSIDEVALQIVNFKTTGRSEEWKQNVLSNDAIKKIQFPLLQKGKHRLKIYAIDPGVILDRITIDFGGLEKGYGIIGETKM